MNKQCAIVLGGKNVNSTGLVRSLGMAGYDVTFASRYAKIESKYTADYLPLPESTEKWLPIVKEYIKGRNRVVFFPTDDESAFFLDDNYCALSEIALIPNAKGALRSLADKTKMAELAQKSGLEVPRYELISCSEGAYKYFGIPSILKPFAAFAGSKGDIRICRSESEYRDAMLMYASKGYERVMQQQLLEDAGQYEVGIIGISLPDGRVVMPGTIRKIRSYPTGRGSTSYAKFERGLPIDEKLLASFVRSTGFVGLFDIEMMISGEKAWFIEINYRNGQYGYIATAAGYNLAENWARGMLGEDISMPADIKEITYINERDDYMHVREGTLSRKQWKQEFRAASAYGIYCKGDQRPYIRQYLKIPDRVVIGLKKTKNRVKDLLVKEEWNIAIRPRNGAMLYEEGGTEKSFSVLKNSLRYWAADPFIISADDKDYLFFEMYDRFKGKGVIGYREIKRDKIGKMRLAYEAPTHLSFPFVFERDGQYYMMPESSKSRELYLLKASDLPHSWKLSENYINGRRFVDSVLYANEGESYLFTHEIDEKYAFDSLDVYFRREGEWIPHPYNHVVSGAEASRLAGAVFEHNESIYRVAQDCSESYGRQISFSRINEISPESYAEEPVRCVSVEEIDCRKKKKYDGMHTYNFSDRYEVIDLKNKEHIRAGNIINVFLRLIKRV